MTATELDHIAAVMWRHRITRLKAGDVEIEMSPAAFIERGPIVPEGEPIGAAKGHPTEDELLFWSTPDLPNINAEKP